MLDAAPASDVVLTLTSAVDEATVWLESANGECLEAVYNPVNETLPGLRQPMTRASLAVKFGSTIGSSLQFMLRAYFSGFASLRSR